MYQLMYQVVVTAIEMFAAAVVLVPVFLILGKVCFHDRKRTCFYLIFALYLSAVYSLVGLPNVIYMRFEPSFYLLPFVGMVSDVENSILNVVLFIPLGIMLPALWDEFGKMKKTLLFGAGMTLFIEIMQIFTFRLTDINDLITNIAGTVIGYLLITVMIKKHLWHVLENGNSTDVYMICGITFLTMFFIFPFLNSALWSFII